MTTADYLFHNIYLLQEIFSHKGVGYKYCKIKNGNLIARGGLTILLQLNANFENDLYFTERAMDFAAMNGHLDTIKWLHINREEGCSALALPWAAEHGQLDVVHWLLANHNAAGINIDSITILHAYYAASNNGHPIIAQLLQVNIQL